MVGVLLAIAGVVFATLAGVVLILLAYARIE